MLITYIFIKHVFLRLLVSNTISILYDVSVV